MFSIYDYIFDSQFTFLDGLKIFIYLGYLCFLLIYYLSCYLEGLPSPLYKYFF